MTTPDDIQRIARAMNALRPDWAIPSLITFLGRNHSDRATRDLTIAAIVVATDPKTATPQLLNQHGPWWAAAQTVAGGTASTVPGAVPGPNDARCPDHPHEHLRGCRACRSENLEGTTPLAGYERPEDHHEAYRRGAAWARAELARAKTTHTGRKLTMTVESTTGHAYDPITRRCTACGIHDSETAWAEDCPEVTR
jgi:hypothetical protein